jgi:RNA polymerase sigma factor (TIGR02999 family)
MLDFVRSDFTLSIMNSKPGESSSTSPSLPATTEELLPLVYGELRRLAASRMAQESPGMTIQATALVHEAWMRLEREQKGWANRAQFFAAAAEAMRRILIEQARRRVSEKRGGGAAHEPLTDSIIEIIASNEEIFAVHAALDALAAEDEQAATLVKLRFFAGMGMQEAATALDLPLRSAERLWTFARARLRSVITEVR